ncbi:D-alanine--D-alanine ligase [Thermoanaerobacterium sp. CMT5567-10]|uniref:D-alanine--D-alanine ligase family protein n=1 Tax=Thermoanaerobacterium sp. CMT5567-10 TaxID=3061989 RepID=UPI0026E0D83D|nr:D-alanine--D-alanine ligase [Thermoanaerobacterium sp. CMT5567-10]WKV08441.1 D-alanine--D-alanine ligase [Thermoanaerobacterium sp. CMT5567-10]
MKIVVLAGGLSPERDVSLSSGCLIANALLENGHKVLLLDLYKGLNFDNDFDELFLNSEIKRYQYSVPKHEPDLDKLMLEADNGKALIGKNVIKICRSADVVFLALHGSIGENGQLQAVFDSFGICYTGTGYIGSLLAMDKALSKELMRFNKLPTPDWKIFDLRKDYVDYILDGIGLPCVIKPCSCGSSIGVSIVKNENELSKAIEYAKKYENRLLIEKVIEGREFSVGILNGKALPVIEIIPNIGFYDYKNKYQPGLTKEICPAQISQRLTQKLQDQALKVHEILRLGDYSRIDFIVDDKDNVYCLEANTLPGMTPTSLLPQEANAIGLSYNELCEKIVSLALRRN